MRHTGARSCQTWPRPSEAYMNLVTQPPIDLLDANGNPTGIKITGEMHTPNIVKEIDSFPNSYAEITVGAGGQTEVVKLHGPTTVQVCIQDTDGFAADVNGNGLDEVPTQMTQFDLAGMSAIFGPVRVRLDAARPTVGAIQERVNNTPGTLDLPPFAAA